jgi:predicted trehalose synthase
MKKLIPLFLYFVCISSASAQSTISVLPERHSKTDTVRVIWDMCYNYKSQQLTEWANAIEQTRPLTVEELNQFFEAKMILLSEYSVPSH